jgi:pimeloyl-ACP methyl ester carboxylesterase
MKRLLVIACMTLLLGYGTICALMWWQQRSLMYFPSPARPVHDRAPTLQVPAQTAASGQAIGPALLRLAVLEPREHGPERKALIYFGGNAEEVSDSLPDLARAFPDHAIYALHYRGYSGSSGEPSEPALHADALALYEHLRRSYTQIALVGRSLGSGIATRLASLRPVSQLVLVTPYDSLLRVAQHAYRWLPVAWLLEDRYESWRDAPRVSAPTRLILAGRDEVIPPEHGQALARCFQPGVAQVHLLAEAGHNDIAGFAEYAALLRGRR